MKNFIIYCCWASSLQRCFLGGESASPRPEKLRLATRHRPHQLCFETGLLALQNGLTGSYVNSGRY
jgi:hypothetical protein